MNIISAGLNVETKNEIHENKDTKISSKKITQQKSFQNLKIGNPQPLLPKIKEKNIKPQESKLDVIDLETSRRPKTARPKTAASVKNLNVPNDVPVLNVVDQVGQPKPKQIVRKNTITQLNHVPFPERKIIFSIDPGRVNFACRLEERKVDGSIEGLLFIKARFEELLDINKFFDQHYDLLSQTTICIVEKQMSINYTMIRVSQHVETYFLTKFPHVAVFEISAKLKVGKEVTIDTAKQILERGKDQTSVKLLEKLGNPQKEAGKRKPKKEKLDDLCDTVCQIEAFMEEMKRLEYKVPQGYILQTKAGGKK